MDMRLLLHSFSLPAFSLSVPLSEPIGASFLIQQPGSERKSVSAVKFFFFNQLGLL